VAPVPSWKLKRPSLAWLVPILLHWCYLRYVCAVITNTRAIQIDKPIKSLKPSLIHLIQETRSIRQRDSNGPLVGRCCSQSKLTAASVQFVSPIKSAFLSASRCDVWRAIIEWSCSGMTCHCSKNLIKAVSCSDCESSTPPPSILVLFI